jgi:hypothetical protein
LPDGIGRADRVLKHPAGPDPSHGGDPMAKASQSYHKISDLLTDPILRAVFQRAERDYGQTFAIPDEPRPVLDAGAAERIDELEEAVS